MDAQNININSALPGTSVNWSSTMTSAMTSPLTSPMTSPLTGSASANGQYSMWGDGNNGNTAIEDLENYGRMKAGVGSSPAPPPAPIGTPHGGHANVYPASQYGMMTAAPPGDHQPQFGPVPPNMYPSMMVIPGRGGENHGGAGVVGQPIVGAGVVGQPVPTPEGAYMMMYAPHGPGGPPQDRPLMVGYSMPRAGYCSRYHISLPQGLGWAVSHSQSDFIPKVTRDRQPLLRLVDSSLKQGSVTVSRF